MNTYRREGEEKSNPHGKGKTGTAEEFQLARWRNAINPEKNAIFCPTYLADWSEVVSIPGVYQIACTYQRVNATPYDETWVFSFRSN